MKRILTAAALLLVVAACNKDENYNDKYGDRAVIPPKGQSLRVMTYNIYGARATSPANAADLDAIAEVIRRQNPDFVTLNEVDVFTNRTGKDVHQARDLAEKLGMEWHFSKAIDRDGGEYGDAVLAKIVMGSVANDNSLGWNATFWMFIVASLLATAFCATTWKREKQALSR